MRNLRSAIIGVLRADYVDFARAKGITPWRVPAGHVLRNSLITTVALFGLNIGVLLGNSVITENVFAVPGIGWHCWSTRSSAATTLCTGSDTGPRRVVSLVFLTMISGSWLNPRLHA